MYINMDAEEHNIQNILTFIKLQDEIIGTFLKKDVIWESAPTIEDMFRIFDEHFLEFYEKDTFRKMLMLLHRCVKAWISRGDYLKDDIGVRLVSLMKKRSDFGNGINFVFQIIYQVMNSIKHFGKNDVLISEELLNNLIEIMPVIENRVLASNWIACIQKYIEISPQCRKNLQSLWSYLKQNLEINLNKGLVKDIEIDILIQLMDDFELLQPKIYDEPIIINIIQYLLKVDQKQLRKCGYYLLRKFFTAKANIVINPLISSYYLQKIEQSWMMYITMLECLEEEQSHLILPSLENLEELVKSKHLPSSWMDILYERILIHNNSLVLRLSIELFLKSFSCYELSGNVLKQLLQVTNSNSLFNYEGYFLKKDYFCSFLKGNTVTLFPLLSEIENWKSVPLYMWLENLKELKLSKLLTFKDILNMSSCIRKLQNCYIRKKSIEVWQVFLREEIAKMSMEDYVMYIETLYNTSDSYLEHDMFFSKILLYKSKPVEHIFTQRFYEIFTNTKWDNKALLLFLNEVPIEQHGWLKFAPFKLELDEWDRNCIYNIYQLDSSSFTIRDIHEVLNAFKNILLGSQPHNKHELIACSQAAVSFYIYQNPNFDFKKEETLWLIFNTGINHSIALDTFAEKLLDNTQEKIELCFIDELLKYNNRKMLECVSRYICKVYDENIVRNYAVIILKKCESYLNSFENINILKLLTDEWLKQSASQGDKRIEEAFLYNHFKYQICSLRLYCLQQAQKYGSVAFILDLLKYHAEITLKKPRYFENSSEHRVKLKIAYCIYISITLGNINKAIVNHMWNILCSENNQLNVIYIYEYILGKIGAMPDEILSKLKAIDNFTPSVQISIISVAYIYIRTYETTEAMENTAVYTLLSLTMGANFQTRLFAQMALYELLKNPLKAIENSKKLIQSIEDAIGNKLKEYLNDARLHIYKISDALTAILYITNAPFEIYDLSNVIDENSELNNTIECCRKRYLNKTKTIQKEEATLKGTSDKIQRKMNPINELTEPHNLFVHPIKATQTEMFVVASLVDKLPNLGGIARTCEVLGIKNLVMDSKTNIGKYDFKNLSMTAEKNLNILEVKPKDLKEFLICKKSEGYEIVGAEQTYNSQSLNHFQFPKKCVLLMGHEKNGIPPPLLGLLDKAVEIPQFGQIRSLNVHVTGALFMWEYCKQHFIEKQ